MCGRVRHGTFREPREGSSFAKVSCAKRGKLEEEEVGNEGRENEKEEKERKKKTKQRCGREERGEKG